VAAATLQPTLWRTCRAIANHRRLQIFGLLLQQPGLTVSAVAACLKQPLSLTSDYLRVLEARGLLTASRVGSHVKYLPGDHAKSHATQGLVTALRRAFLREKQPVETVFRLATAFTHPRRIEVFRLLQSKPLTLAQIVEATGIPARALRRHLWKLESRGFVAYYSRTYTPINRTDSLGQELARLATK
jgi:DNA-binding IclR family transcriptional regulator